VKCDDYQQFTLDGQGHVTNIGQRMRSKLRAIPLPEDLSGKRVLDVGCDMGFWSFLCSERGAKVVGLDRSRKIKGEFVDLIQQNRRASETYPLHNSCLFFPIELGKQWLNFGDFDLVLMFSLYHHVYEQAGDHNPIWFWLWNHGPVLWENPLDTNDVVVKINVSKEYNKNQILKASEAWFNREYIGPAQHEPHRHVFRFTPKTIKLKTYNGRRRSGAGGASKAWTYKDSRRTLEFKQAVGVEVHPGSINMDLSEPFNWDSAYYRFKMLDTVTRNKGFDTDWDYRWVRTYPVKANGKQAYVFRFEGESYSKSFIEVISEHWIEESAIEIVGYDPN